MSGGSPKPQNNVWILSLTVFIITASLYSWTRLLPLLLRDLGAGDVQVGLAYTLMSLAATMAQIPGGLLADRYGRKPMIVLPSYGLSLVYVLAARSGSWQAMVAYLVAINLCHGLQSPAFVAIIAESVTGTRRGYGFAALQFCIGASVAIGPGIGAVLAPWVDTRLLMESTGWAFFAMGFIRHLTLTDTGQRTVRTAWRPRLDRPLLRVLAIGTLFVAISYLTVWGPFFSLYASNVLGMTDRDINVLFAAAGLVAVCFSFAGGRATDRFGAEKVMMGSVGLHAVACLCWLITGSLLSAAMVLTVAIASLQAATVAWDTMRAAVAEGVSRGLAVGVVATITGAIAGVVPGVAGALAARFGQWAPFALTAVLASGLMLVMLRRVTGADERGDATIGPYSG